jgi:hypothetical protein
MLKGDALSFYLSNHFNTQDNATIEQVGNLIVGSPTQRCQPAPSVTSEAWHSASQLCWVW